MSYHYLASHPDRVSLADDLRALGLAPGDTVMVHAAFRALGVRDPDAVILALLDVLGDAGTLLMPALSWLQEPPDVHDTRATPSCVGFLPEYFRTRPGTRRSLHPTHSVCGVGVRADELLEIHHADTTPCGPHSPFSAILRGGMILFLGCGLRPNTAMHAVEEHAQPPYLFGPPRLYTITDENGQTFQRVYTPHGFAGVTQRYDRVADLLAPPALQSGYVGAAAAFLVDGPVLLDAALAALRRNPYFFVEPDGAEGA
ncbi:MAG TPA: AAC(3) family N-acetyltransferase [Chloroflexaceae bacterium]|nr:AAC(3) family N-acetyltransferase [Chloroflexaceae bacterium]